MKTSEILFMWSDKLWFVATDVIYLFCRLSLTTKRRAHPSLPWRWRRERGSTRTRRQAAVRRCGNNCAIWRSHGTLCTRTSCPVRGNWMLASYSGRRSRTALTSLSHGWLAWKVNWAVTLHCMRHWMKKSHSSVAVRCVGGLCLLVFGKKVSVFVNLLDVVI